jgi:hypothetical protein
MVSSSERKRLLRNLAAPMGATWGNVAQAELGNLRRSSSSRSAHSSARSFTPTPEPRSGATYGRGKNMMIYTRKVVHALNGKKYRGKWVRAIDPEGKYGGPYANGIDLHKNPKFRKEFGESRGRNRSGSRSTRRSRSGSSRGSRRSSRRSRSRR